jgi:hypothetical protein
MRTRGGRFFWLRSMRMIGIGAGGYELVDFNRGGFRVRSQWKVA